MAVESSLYISPLAPGKAIAVKDAKWLQGFEVKQTMVLTSTCLFVWPVVQNPKIVSVLLKEKEAATLHNKEAGTRECLAFLTPITV